MCLNNQEVRPGIRLVLLAVLLNEMAVLFSVPALPHLLRELAGGELATAAYLVGALAAVFMGMQFLFGPLMGLLSDRYGRRRILLGSGLALMLDLALMSVSSWVAVFFIGHALAGVFVASNAAAAAYIADSANYEERPQAFGWLSAVWGIALIAGPALGGALSLISLRAPFYAGAALALLSFLYVAWLVPESLAPERRLRAIPWHNAAPWGVLRFLAEVRSRRVMFFAFVMLNIAHASITSTAVLYADARYGWNAAQVGVALAGAGLLNVLVVVFLVPRATKAFGTVRTLVTACVCASLGYFAFGLAPTSTLFLAAVPVACLGAMAWPALQTRLTAETEESEAGRLQGVLTSLASLAYVVGPMAFSALFAWGVTRGSAWMGLSFFVASACAAVAALKVSASMEGYTG